LNKDPKEEFMLGQVCRFTNQHKRSKGSRGFSDSKVHLFGGLFGIVPWEEPFILPI
jgi:hypothetical protein